MTESELGYVFISGRSCFGDEQLDVFLRQEPSQKHFDPEKIHLKVSTTRGVQALDIHHPWRQAGENRLCAGHIRVFDRYQKFIDVFSFGGSLQITAVIDQTTCIITSPAPLLELTAGNATDNVLASEIDVMLAQQRARINPRIPAEFDGKLAVIDPFSFYITCLSALSKKFAYNTNADLTRQNFKHQLNLEIARLQKESSWPSSIPTLAELIDQRP